ncbi:hypothetical protein BCR44DRAFT_96289 [Catenaria anguillulae PL171]|uniref:Uncharacterized protein n=1 Tax=Catenaria anguillulae PL171 TaxID=765915 RepID=A0A1Y2I4G8_9FUNG|nr:hypothetical protein BCR44DRAFT_96289 [Catenaria anguillulae PL171]
MAILVQEALDALFSSPSSGSPMAGGASAEYSLPVSSDPNDAVLVKGLVSVNGFTITRSNIEVKFPSRGLLRLAFNPCILHPVMEAHHHASAVVSVLQSTMQPYSFHSIEALTTQLTTSLQTALAHVRHGHRTVGPPQSHPLALSPEHLIGMTTAVGGDHLVLTIAALYPTQSSSSTTANASSTAIATSANASNSPAGKPNPAAAAIRELHSHARNASLSGSAGGSGRGHARHASLGGGAAALSPLAQGTGSGHSSPTPSASGPNAGSHSRLSGVATPPPPATQPAAAATAPFGSNLTPSASSSSVSPLAVAKLKASSSIRSALNSVGGGAGGAGNGSAAASIISPADKYGGPNMIMLGDQWHEVQAETSIEIGWKNLVQFRDKLAQAQALNKHLAMQMVAFTALAAEL